MRYDMILLKTAAFFLLITGISCCNNSKLSSTDSPEAIAERLATKKFKSGYAVRLNERKTAVLISKLSNPKSNAPYHTIHFAAYKIPGKELIIERTVARSSGVDWSGNDIIEWQIIPGRLAPGQKQAKRYRYSISKKQFVNHK